MKVVFLSGVAFGALIAVSSAGFAADMPAKASYYKASPIAAYDWTGFYLGVNAGRGVARNSNRLASDIFLSDEKFATQPAGWLGGAQIGYNWQVARLVMGIEADLQKMAGHGDSVCVVRCIPAASGTVDQNLSWLGTVRGRVGYATGPVLLYATGGLAYGQVKSSVTVVDPPSPNETHVFDRTKAGWTAGGGIEAALVGAWTAKAEYLYVDLGRVSGNFDFAATIPNTFTTDVREHLFRAGVNYRFGDAATSAAVVTPTHDWTGLYFGGNAGYHVGRNRGSFTAIGFQPQAETFSLDPAGVLGGGQIGYNHQIANWVFGLEADLQKTSSNSSANCLFVCGVAGIAAMSVEDRLSWFGTVRGRVGYASGPALFYATGGLALAKANLHVDYHSAMLIPGTITESVDVSQTKRGWTLGGGIETALAGGWSMKAEYLYLNLGSVAAGFDTDFGLGFTVTNAVTSDLREHVARVGLNYNLNAGPVTAKY